MRLLVIASVFLWSFNGIGQITITNLDFATAGDDVILSTTTDMGIDYSSTGINHVWDFSGLVPESQIGVSYNGMSGVSFLVNVIFGSFAAGAAKYASSAPLVTVLSVTWLKPPLIAPN